MIGDLKSKFPEKIVGYSDHTLPKDMKILEVATLLGASIEKHFTYDKTRGNDHYHAMDRMISKFFIKTSKSCIHYRFDEEIFNSVGKISKRECKEVSG